MVANSKPTSPSNHRQAPTIHLIGDSTMANKCLLNANPERGWGQVLHECFLPEIGIENHACDGRSSKSFIWEGLWTRTRRAFRPGDWLVIQFGHNDQKLDRPLLCTDPDSSYPQFLTRFVREADALGVFPVFATPIARRQFSTTGLLENTLGEYPAAMRQLARDIDVPLIELNEQTHLQISALGPEKSKSWFLHLPAGKHPLFPAGRADNTHLSLIGARAVAALFAQEVRLLLPDLAQWLHTDHMPSRARCAITQPIR